MRSVL